MMIRRLFVALACAVGADYNSFRIGDIAGSVVTSNLQKGTY